MGFSLKMFIQELEDILANSSIFTICSKLKECVARNKQYAKDCGQL